MCCNQKRHGDPKVFDNMEHEVSAHPWSEGWVTDYGATVRKCCTDDRCHLGNGSTAEEFWIGFVSHQRPITVPIGAETHDRTFLLPLWPSLPSSASSVAFADGNWACYTEVYCCNLICWLQTNGLCTITTLVSINDAVPLPMHSCIYRAALHTCPFLFPGLTLRGVLAWSPSKYVLLYRNITNRRPDHSSKIVACRIPFILMIKLVKMKTKSYYIEPITPRAVWDIYTFRLGLTLESIFLIIFFTY